MSGQPGTYNRLCLERPGTGSKYFQPELKNCLCLEEINKTKSLKCHRLVHYSRYLVLVCHTVHRVAVNVPECSREAIVARSLLRLETSCEVVWQAGWVSWIGSPSSVSSGFRPWLYTLLVSKLLWASY